MKDTQELHDLAYFGNVQLTQSILKEWHKAKPNNVHLKAMIKAVGEMHFYTSRLRDDCNKTDKRIIDIENQRDRWAKKAVQLERDLKMATIE